MTPGKELEGRRVLIVEDRYVLASEIAELVRDMGAEVLGPAASVSAAEALVRELRANIALLDVNLGGEMIFPLAEQLAKQQTPRSSYRLPRREPSRRVALLAQVAEAGGPPSAVGTAPAACLIASRLSAVRASTATQPFHTGLT